MAFCFWCLALCFPTVRRVFSRLWFRWSQKLSETRIKVEKTVCKRPVSIINSCFPSLSVDFWFQLGGLQLISDHQTKFGWFGFLQLYCATVLCLTCKYRKDPGPPQKRHSTFWIGIHFWGLPNQPQNIPNSIVIWGFVAVLRFLMSCSFQRGLPLFGQNSPPNFRNS